MVRQRGRPARLTLKKALAVFDVSEAHPTWGARLIAREVQINHNIVFQLMKRAHTYEKHKQ
jgi:hypothetical protein